MAVLSPALVVAMCVMFVLTRLHSHFYIFEHPLLFGLKYCVQPDKNDLAAITEATNKGSQTGKKKGRQLSSTSKTSKITVTALPVRRGKINQAFFPAEAEFPHHRALAHVTGIVSGYLAAFLFEDIMGCLFPGLLSNRRSFYVAFFAIGYAVYEAIKISIGLTSLRFVVALAGASWIVALFIVSAGDFNHFIKFDKAFAALSNEVTIIFREVIDLEPEKSVRYATITSLVVRILVTIVAALIAASTAVPARRFSRIDYDLNLQYRMDEADRRNDPYALAPPTPRTMMHIALDYVAPLAIAFLWAVGPRDDDSYSGWRLIGILLSVAVRFSMARIRIQGYLDGAIDAYRRFWTEKSVNGVIEAGRNCSFQVMGTSFYVMLITMAYVAPSLLPLVFALVAKHDGGFRPGFCRGDLLEDERLMNTFFREIGGFFAWWSLASYAAFGTISLLTEFLVDFVDPTGRERRGKLPVATSSSEKRRERRLLQERMMRHHLRPASTP